MNTTNTTETNSLEEEIRNILIHFIRDYEKIEKKDRDNFTLTQEFYSLILHHSKQFNTIIIQAKAEAVREFAEHIRDDARNGVEYNSAHGRNNDGCNLTDIQVNAYLNYWLERQKGQGDE